MPSQSLATRKLQEQFQIQKAMGAGASTASTATTSALSSVPTDPNALADFEAKINAPDYPPALKESYYLSKSKGDFTNFNSDVEKFNVAQKAEADKFESTVSSQDYPQALREIYQQAKEKGDFTGFNEAVSKYNAEQDTKLAEFEKQVNAPDYPAELKEAYRKAKEAGDFSPFNKAVADINAKTKRQFEQNQELALVYGEQAQAAQRDQAVKDIAAKYEVPVSEIDKLLKTLEINPNDESLTNNDVVIAAVKDLINQTGVSGGAGETFYGRIYEQVGADPNKPEYILKSDYEKIKAESPALAETIKTKGLAGYSAGVKQYNELKGSEYKQWFDENIKADPYLGDVFAKEGEQAALNAYDKRIVDLQGVYDRWVDANIKADPYLNNILNEKGEKAALDALKKRYGDLKGIYERQNNQQQKEFVTWLREKGPRELYYVYTHQSKEDFDKAFNEYYANHEEAMKEVAPYIIEPTIGIKQPREKDVSVSGRVTPEKEFASIVPKGESGTIDIVKYIEDGKDEKYLKALGVTEQDIQDTKHYIAAAGTINDYTARYFKQRGWDTEIPFTGPGQEPDQKKIQEFQERYNEAAKSYYETAPEKRPTALIKEFALNSVPILGTIRYAKQAKEGGLTAGEIGLLSLQIGFDLATLIPIAGQFSAAARGTFMAGKSGAFVSRGVQLREFGKAAGGIVLGEIKAPFTMIAHPIETAKATLSPIETLTRWQVKVGDKTLIKAKIPLSAAETKWNTMRIPVAMVGGDEKTAMQLRDKVTKAMVHGEGSEATVNGWTVKLNPAAINRMGEPLAISATPDVRPFVNGATIGKGMPVEMADGRTVIMGEGRDLYLAPTLHSRFAEATSTGMIPKNASPGAIILRGENLIKELESSQKIYAGTAEIESVIKAKKNLNIGKPVQALVSRTSSGKKLTWLVFGKPFTQSEIGAMKFQGSADTLAQIFQVPVKVNGKSVNEFMNSETGYAGKATEANFRVPIRTVVANYTNTGIIDNYRALTGDTRKDIVLGSEKPKDKEEKDKEEKRDENKGKFRLPDEEELRGWHGYINPSQGERRPPTGKEQEYRGIRVESEGRRFVGIERRDAGTGPRRGFVEPERRGTKSPEGRRVIPPERRSEIPSDKRTPPEAPERRTPPESLDRRTISELPESRTPPKPPERIQPPAPETRYVTKTSLRKQRAGTDAEKREIIAEAGGAIAINMGEVGSKGNRKRVWDTVKNDYQDNADYLQVLGKPPEGATIITKGKGSAYATAQMLHGEPPTKEVQIDKGIMDIRLKADGKRITARFVPDPKQQTVGDITIGHPKTSISERKDLLSKQMPPISKRGVRISGKMPRLR